MGNFSPNTHGVPVPWVTEHSTHAVGLATRIVGTAASAFFSRMEHLHPKTLVLVMVQVHEPAAKSAQPIVCDSELGEKPKAFGLGFGYQSLQVLPPITIRSE